MSDRTPPASFAATVTPFDGDVAGLVRARPGMYVGSTGGRGIEYMLREVVGNAVDLALTGAVTELRVRVHGDGTLTVADDGPGIDVTPGADGVPFLTRVLTTSHDTPTADGHEPHVHLGIGVGLHAVCALSDRLVVTTTRAGRTWRQGFAAGRTATPLDRLDPPGAPGTAISFRPDPAIFHPAHRIDLGRLDALLRELASLVPGLTARLETEERAWPPGSPARLLPDPARPAWQVRTAAGPDTLTIAFAVRPVGHGPTRARWWLNVRELHEIEKLTETLDEAFGAVLDRDGGLDVVGSAMLLSAEFSGPTRARCDDPRLPDLIRRAAREELPGLLASDGALRAALLP